MTSEPDPTAVLLASPVRREIVDTLANLRLDPTAPAGSHAGQTAAQLAHHLDLHVSTVRFHLDQLVAAGLLHTSFERGVGAGRPRKVYAVAPGSLDDSRDGEALKMLSSLLASSFGATANGQTLTPLEAGRRWAREHVPSDPHDRPADSAGRWLAKVGRMVDVLHDWGYTPELSTTDGGRTARVDLLRCPFLELARANPAVVCGIHRGLIQGSMEQLGEPDTTVGLEPFVGPDLCVARVSTHAPFNGAPARPHPATTTILPTPSQES